MAVLSAEVFGEDSLAVSAAVLDGIPADEVIRALAVMSGVFLRYALARGLDGEEARGVMAWFLEGLGDLIAMEAVR